MHLIHSLVMAQQNKREIPYNRADENRTVAKRGKSGVLASVNFSLRECSEAVEAVKFPI